MGIRFKYDATGVVIPPNKAQQKFGEQLVLNQQKYANDVRQNIYDQQKQGMQNRFQANLQENQLTAQAKLQEVRGQQALGELNAQQTFGAKMQQNTLDARQQEMQQRAQQQTKQQQRADDFSGIKSGAFQGKTAADIEAAHAFSTQIDLQGQRGEMDAAQVAEAHAKNQADLNELRKGRIPVPSMTEQSNQNLQYYNPKTRGYIDKAAADQLPPGEVHVYQNGHLMPGPTAPMTAGSYYSNPKNDKAYKQDYANAKKEIQTEIEDGGKAMSPEEIHAEASRRMELDYNNKQKNIAAWQAQGMPAMPPAAAGQPVTPPAAPGQVPPPAATTALPVEQPVGIPNLEPTYNPDGTSNALGATTMPPAQGGQQSQAASEAAAASAAQMPPSEQDIIDEIYPSVAPTDATPAAQPGTFAELAAADVAARAAQPPVSEAEKEGMRQNGFIQTGEHSWEKPLPGTAPQSSPAPTPDFSKLIAGATDESDRNVLGKLQGIYGKQSPEVQKAIDVLVHPGSDTKLTAQAYEYLKSKGIDVSKLGGPQPGTGAYRLNEYQNNLTTTMR